MAVGRYLVVDTDTKTIIGGPYKWDPETAPGWEPPDEGDLMLEGEALEQGYTWPDA